MSFGYREWFLSTAMGLGGMPKPGLSRRRHGFACMAALGLAMPHTEDGFSAQRFTNLHAGARILSRTYWRSKLSRVRLNRSRGFATIGPCQRWRT